MNNIKRGVISRPPVMTPQRIEVRSEGENVVLVVGGAELRMQYEDALKISQWIRLRAKEAKARCGDVSRHWSGIGLLSSVEEIEGSR